jgi:predicted Zn-dependent protease
MSIVFSFLTAVVGLAVTLVELKLEEPKERRKRLLIALAAIAFLLSVCSAIWAAYHEGVRAEVALIENDDLRSRLDTLQIEQKDATASLSAQNDQLSGKLSQAQLALNEANTRLKAEEEKSTRLDDELTNLKREAKKFTDARDKLRRMIEDALNNVLVKTVKPVEEALKGLRDELNKLAP